MLEPGVEYAWCVKAFTDGEITLLQNDGHSEVFSFVYGSLCPGLENIRAEVMGPERAIILWDADPAHSSFTTRFRKKDGSDGVWHTRETYTSSVEITNVLSPGTSYEYQVKHTFDENYALEKKSTDNLMDYTDGTVLFKQQWSAMYDEQALLFAWLQDGSEGELHIVDDLLDFIHYVLDLAPTQHAKSYYDYLVYKRNNGTSKLFDQYYLDIEGVNFFLGNMIINKEKSLDIISEIAFISLSFPGHSIICHYQVLHQSICLTSYFYPLKYALEISNHIQVKNNQQCIAQQRISVILCIPAIFSY